MLQKQSVTQFAKLCELREGQLSSCALRLLQTTQVIVLGKTPEGEVVNAQKLDIHQLQKCISVTIDQPTAFQNFCDRLAIDTLCTHLPALIEDSCRTHILFHNFKNIAVPQNSMVLLWQFVLRSCFEQPCLLNAQDDRVGTNLQRFRYCLARFIPECLLQSMPKMEPSCASSSSSSSVSSGLLSASPTPHHHPSSNSSGLSTGYGNTGLLSASPMSAQAPNMSPTMLDSLRADRRHPSHPFGPPPANIPKTMEHLRVQSNLPTQASIILQKPVMITTMTTTANTSSIPPVVHIKRGLPLSTSERVSVVLPNASPLHVVQGNDKKTKLEISSLNKV